MHMRRLRWRRPILQLCTRTSPLRLRRWAPTPRCQVGAMFFPGSPTPDCQVGDTVFPSAQVGDTLPLPVSPEHMLPIQLLHI